MSKESDVDISQFSKIIAELERAVPGMTKEKIIRAESKSILQKTMDSIRSKAAAKVRKRVERTYSTWDGVHAGSRAQIPKISVTRKNVWLLTEKEKGGIGTFDLDHSRRSDEKWRLAESLRSSREAHMDARIEEMLGRRGLPKQSWYLLAKSIGESLNAPGYVQNASVKGKILSEVVNTVIERSQTAFSILFENKSKATWFNKGYSKLLAAIRGRINFFKKNLEKGVFHDLKQIAAKYPGLQIKQ